MLSGIVSSHELVDRLRGETPSKVPHQGFLTTYGYGTRLHHVRLLGNLRQLIGSRWHQRRSVRVSVYTVYHHLKTILKNVQAAALAVECVTRNRARQHLQYVKRNG